MEEFVSNDTLNERYKDYASDILNIIRSNLSHDELRDALGNYHDNDIAKIFEDLSKE